MISIDEIASHFFLSHKFCRGENGEKSICNSLFVSLFSLLKKVRRIAFFIEGSHHSHLSHLGNRPYGFAGAC